MADNETIADIIAWLRRPREGENGYLTLWRDEIADRLKAAHRREIGDAAKLRWALVYAEKVLDTAARNTRGETGMVVDSDYAEAARKCRAALAAPARNCDRFASAEEAWDAYDEWVDSYRSKGKTEPFNEFGWLFAPATEKEGGAE